MSHAVWEARPYRAPPGPIERPPPALLNPPWSQTASPGGVWPPKGKAPGKLGRVSVLGRRVGTGVRALN